MFWPCGHANLYTTSVHTDLHLYRVKYGSSLESSLSLSHARGEAEAALQDANAEAEERAQAARPADRAAATLTKNVLASRCLNKFHL